MIVAGTALYVQTVFQESDSGRLQARFGDEIGVGTSQECDRLVQNIDTDALEQM